MAVCDPDTPAYVITRYLGFICEDANPVAALRNPFGLENWTLPVLEVTIILGAVLALLHAIRRLRRDNDPTNLALWIGSLVYLFVIEPPLYFPEWFGMQDAMGFMFAHNVFTVDFMYDRLPLYIVCFYPALSQVAYEIVRAFGFFDGTKHAALKGAVAVAFVYQVFYEIFDQLGPQLKWWAWNVDEPFYGNTAADLGNPAAVPLLASVPLNSVWLFASVSFGVLTYVSTRLIANPTLQGNAPRGLSLAWRIVVSGVLAVISMPLMGIPASVFGRGEGANLTGQAIVLGVEIAALWLVGLYLLGTQWRKMRAAAAAAHSPARTARPFLLVFPFLFLGVHTALWISALPDYFGATDGVTDDGTPIGSLPYVIACLVVALGSLLAALALGRDRTEPAATAGEGDAATRQQLNQV